MASRKLLFSALSAGSAVNELCLPVTTIVEVGKHEGQQSQFAAGSITFGRAQAVISPISRRSGVIQGVVPKNAVAPEVFEAVKTLTQESSVIVEGKVRADKRAPSGYELDVSNVRVIQRVPDSEPYPSRPKSTAWNF